MADKQNAIEARDGFLVVHDETSNYMDAQGFAEFVQRWRLPLPDDADRAIALLDSLRKALGIESPEEELERLVTAYSEAEDGSSVQQEAWNMLADFAYQNSEIICAALAAQDAGDNPE